MNAYLTTDALRLVPELQRYARQRSSGELTVKTERDVAKLAFSQGKLAWIYFLDDQEKLADVLVRRRLVTPQVAMSAYRESRERHKPLGEVLVQWGLVTEKALQDILGGYMRERLGRLLGMRQVDWLFVPRRIDMGTGPTFELGFLLEALREHTLHTPVRELSAPTDLQKIGALRPSDIWDFDADTTLNTHIGPAKPEQSGVTERPHADATPRQIDLSQHSVLHNLHALGGLIAAAVVNLDTRLCIQTLMGSEVPIDVMGESFGEIARFALAAERIADMGDRLDEVLLTLKTRFHLLRLVPSERVAVCLVLDRTAADLGTARLALMLAVESINAENA